MVPGEAKKSSGGSPRWRRESNRPRPMGSITLRWSVLHKHRYVSTGGTEGSRSPTARAPAPAPRRCNSASPGTAANDPTRSQALWRPQCVHPETWAIMLPMSQGRSLTVIGRLERAPSPRARNRLMEKLEFLHFQLTRLQDLIGKADTKAIGTLALGGVLVATLAPRLSALDFAWSAASSQKRILAIIASLLLAAFLFTLAVALYQALRVIVPRLDTSSRGDSAVFFGDIATKTGEEYLALLETNRVLRDMADNVRDLSVILLAKYGQVRRALLNLIGAIILWTLCLAFLVATAA